MVPGAAGGDSEITAGHLPARVESHHGMSRSKSFGERIADVLIEEGLLLPNQLEEAVAAQKKEGGRLLSFDGQNGSMPNRTWPS